MYSFFLPFDNKFKWEGQENQLNENGLRGIVENVCKVLSQTCLLMLGGVKRVKLMYMYYFCYYRRVSIFV